jgi:cytochrome P450
MFLEPPRHTAVRRILRPGFTPSEVTRVAQIVAQHAAASATALARPGKDALETMLRPACRAALSALLGILPDDLPRLVDWSERLMGFVGRSRIDDTVIHDAQQAFAQFTDFTERTLARAASPLARSVGAAVREGALQPPDAVAIYAQLVTGALDPTVTALTVALEALSRGHHYRDGYRSAPDGFVHEAVRLATPFHFAARRALRDLELRGQRIPAGDRVVLVLAAANRDPRRFDAPLEFRWDRTAAHVAFGRGRHACLGAQVAHHTLRAAIDGHLAQPDQLGPLDVSWHITMGMKWPLRVDIAGADR